jgi:hypothetical protein
MCSHLVHLAEHRFSLLTTCCSTSCGLHPLCLLKKGEVGVTLSSRVRSHSCLQCEPTQERADGRRPSHSLLRYWLELCDEISRKSTTGGGDPMDQAHDGEIGMHSGNVAFLH